MKRVIAATGALLVLGSCAVLDMENRRVLNVLDADLAPQSTAASWALVPLTLPVGVAALAVDVEIDATLCVADRAVGT